MLVFGIGSQVKIVLLAKLDQGDLEAYTPI